jgi:hypothetical protein
MIKPQAGAGVAPPAHLGLLLAVVALLALSGRALAVQFTDAPDGISCTHFDLRLGIPWRANGLAWLDADGIAQGKRAFATHLIAANDDARVRRIDVTALVRAWTEGRTPNVGLLLRADSTAVMEFHAREAAQPELRPQLLIETRDGRRRFIEPSADSSIDCSTYHGVGSGPRLLFRKRQLPGAPILHAPILRLSRL